MLCSPSGTQTPQARTGPLPGVTRQPQWLKLGEDLELLDTPGLLMPRLDEPEAAYKLGLIACLKDDIIGGEALAEYLTERLQAAGRAEPLARYAVPAWPAQPREFLAAIARRRGLTRDGGGPDFREAADLLLRDYRAGHLGAWSLEAPPAPARKGAEGT